MKIFGWTRSIGSGPTPVSVISALSLGCLNVFLPQKRARRPTGRTWWNRTSQHSTDGRTSADNQSICARATTTFVVFKDDIWSN